MLAKVSQLAMNCLSSLKRQAYAMAHLDPSKGEEMVLLSISNALPCIQNCSVRRSLADACNPMHWKFGTAQGSIRQAINN